MSVRDLIPWGRGSSRTPTAYRDEANPFLMLHREMNRLFDETFRSFDMTFPWGRGGAGWSETWPAIEVADGEKDIRVKAEVPGLDEKDIEVVLEGDVLTLRGERRSESEDKERQFSERFYGRFERRIPLGVEVEWEKVRASYKNGVLTVTLPKTERAQASTRRIAINGRG